MLVVACVVAAVGWLYVLRDVGVLAFGPSVAGALPLEQLAGADDQPLARLAAAWGPCGALAGSALTATGVTGRWPRALRAALVAAVLLLLAGAISDAAAISDPIVSHLTAQFTRPGTWAAVALTGLGTLWAPRGRRVAPAAPTGR